MMLQYAGMSYAVVPGHMWLPVWTTNFYRSLVDYRRYDRLILCTPHRVRSYRQECHAAKRVNRNQETWESDMIFVMYTISFHSDIKCYLICYSVLVLNYCFGSELNFDHVWCLKIAEEFMIVWKFLMRLISVL